MKNVHKVSTNPKPEPRCDDCKRKIPEKIYSCYVDQGEYCDKCQCKHQNCKKDVLFIGMKRNSESIRSFKTEKSAKIKNKIKDKADEMIHELELLKSKIKEDKSLIKVY